MSFAEVVESSGLPLGKTNINNNFIKCLIVVVHPPFSRGDHVFVNRGLVASLSLVDWRVHCGHGGVSGWDSPGNAWGWWVTLEAQQFCTGSRGVWETTLKPTILTCRNRHCSYWGQTSSSWELVASGTHAMLFGKPWSLFTSPLRLLVRQVQWSARQGMFVSRWRPGSPKKENACVFLKFLKFITQVFTLFASLVYNIV